MHGRCVIFFSFIFSIHCITAKAQRTIIAGDSATIPGTTVVFAGDEYDRGWYHNFFWGKHYRREWTTAVRVRNFMLDTAKGGLTPIQRSGSRQSKGLRLRNKAGKEYVLRSIDKDFGNGLPDIFHGTFISRIAKDQASIGYPYAAITITPMIAATGIYHTNPVIVFVPHQHALDSFDTEYGDQLYLFEERPDDNQEDAPWFGNSKHVIGTEKLFEHIYEDHDKRVDQKAFAKARLFDIFIGDWGRHADQWRWAEFKEDHLSIYKPIPRDRDQAYTRFDGFYPYIATNLFGALFLENFDHHLNNTKRFNTPGHPLDRIFLNELNEEEWVSIARELQQELTDSVISTGVHQLSPEIFALSGESIISKLRSRRDDLEKNARSYYRYLSHNVGLLGSKKRELFEIVRDNPNETTIRIYKIEKDGDIKKTPYYSRVFLKKETKEIRIYGLEGNDVFRVTGASDQGVKIRVIDPEGSDSVSRHPQLKVSAGRKFEFDTLHHKKIDLFLRPLMSPSEYKMFDKDPLDLFTSTGLRISGNVRYISQPWRKKEYEHNYLLSANYGFLRKAFNVGYISTFGHMIGKWDGVIKARIDAKAAENFYGIGNETLDTISKASSDYYGGFSKRFYGGLGLRRMIGRNQSMDITVFYQRVKTENKGHHFITHSLSVDPSVFTTKQFGGIEASYHLNTTNDRVYPHRGIDFNVGGGFVQDIDVKSRSFLKASSSLSFYLPLGPSFTVAIRGGGGIIDGDVDHYHLHTLGGNDNLRGYARERFLGKNIFYNNNELRWITGTHNYFFNGKIGLLAFYDNGRVWQPGESSDRWHSAYGGGLILVPFNKIALTTTYGISKETTQILLKARLFF